MKFTLVLLDYKKLNSSAWFDYEMCSIAASMATMAFNKFFILICRFIVNTQCDTDKKNAKII